jgi:hypothetical protein
VPAGRREVALLLVLVAAALVLALVPWLRTPFAQLAAYDGDGPDPRFDADVDGAALRRAGEVVPEGDTYFLFMPGATPLLAGNVKAAAQLFLLPALPVTDPRRARWVLRYGGGGLPPGLTAGAATELAPGVALVRVRPS